MAVSLSQQGYFTWKEWAATLADELKAAADRGEPDDGSHYYDHWLAALERLVNAKRLTNPPELHERTEWCRRSSTDGEFERGRLD
jgi:nitrile hydratase accessory protein